MIGRLNHVAIAVPDLDEAVRHYRDVLGAELSDPIDLPVHGVTVVFVELPNTRIELLAVLGDRSPIAGFLERQPRGGIHHLCYEVADIDEAVGHLTGSGARLAGDGRVKTGAHGKPVVFLHPGDFAGTLIELEQA